MWNPTWWGLVEMGLLEVGLASAMWLELHGAAFPSYVLGQPESREAINGVYSTINQPFHLTMLCF